jgi:hypothetical protein
VNVHDLNYSSKSRQLLDEISKGEPLSQRDLSRKLNLAFGLVNLFKKSGLEGLSHNKDHNCQRYTFCLTPKGFSEKTRLAYQLLQDY